MQVASPTSPAPTEVPLPDDRNVVQRVSGVIIFVLLVTWDVFLVVMRIPLLILISPLAVPYLLIRRAKPRRHRHR